MGDMSQAYLEYGVLDLMYRLAVPFSTLEGDIPRIACLAVLFLLQRFSTITSHHTNKCVELVWKVNGAHAADVDLKRQLKSYLLPNSDPLRAFFER
jgi:hypothetical protein